MIGQHRDVGFSVAQRGNVNGNHIESVEEILSKGAVLNGLLEVLVGGADDAHIDADGTLTTHLFEGALLKKAQQFYLQQFGQLGYLVEKNRAAVGQFEPTLLVPNGSGESTLYMPEQFALDQPFGQCPQLMGTNGAPPRRLSLCTALATSSLPVPVSPNRWTGKSYWATSTICW